MIKNITDKIQTKLSNGNLNESQLFSEAQNVMKSFGKGGSDASNPLGMFNAMMQSGMMSGLDPENQNIVDEASNIIGAGVPVDKGQTQQLQSQVQLKSTRDRLRKKLEEKKRKLALKEKQQDENETNKIAVQNEEIDLDALANEIEGM